MDDMRALYDLALPVCDNRIERASTLIEACATVALGSGRLTIDVLREYVAQLDTGRE